MLGVKKLYIENVVFLDGELYILDFYQGVFRVDILSGNMYKISRFDFNKEDSQIVIYNNMTVSKETINGVK